MSLKRPRAKKGDEEFSEGLKEQGGGISRASNSSPNMEAGRTNAGLLVGTALSQLSESDAAELKEKAHPDFWAFYRQKRAYCLDVKARGRREKDNDIPLFHEYR